MQNHNGRQHPFHGKRRNILVEEQPRRSGLLQLVHKVKHVKVFLARQRKDIGEDFISGSWAINVNHQYQNGLDSMIN